MLHTKISSFDLAIFRDVSTINSRRPDQQITLPEDNPALFAKSLEYIYYGKIEILTYSAKALTLEEMAQQVPLAQVYVYAARCCVEDCEDIGVD